MWFNFSIPNDAWVEELDRTIGVDGINNMNTLPFENIPFNKINSMGQQWVRKFSLALSKETLGQIRGKFGGTIPIPGESVTLNASDLLTQAAAEQTALKEELNKQLDEMLYSKLAETDKAMIDNTDAIVCGVIKWLMNGKDQLNHLRQCFWEKKKKTLLNKSTMRLSKGLLDNRFCILLSIWRQQIFILFMEKQ
jgi:hypothetical protein